MNDKKLSHYLVDYSRFAFGGDDLGLVVVGVDHLGVIDAE